MISVGLARTLSVTLCSILACVLVLAGIRPSQAQGSIFSPSTAPAPSFYVSFPDSGNVGVFDPSTLALETIIPTSIGVQTILVDPTRPVVYFSDGQTLQQYSTDWHYVSDSLKLPVGANYFVINDRGDRIYALSGQTIFVVSTHKLHVLTSITLPYPAGAIALSDKFHALFAAEYVQNRIAIVDTRTLSVARDKNAGYCEAYGPCDPFALAVSPDQNTLLALGNNYQGKKIDVIAFDIASEKRFAQCESRISKGQSQVLGVDPSTAMWWFVGSSDRVDGSKEVGVSMSSPCQQIQYQVLHVRIGAAAFSPTGQGVGSVVGRGNRAPDGIVSFPSGGMFFGVWSSPAAVAWVP
jgi:hypothetical protein